MRTLDIWEKLKTKPAGKWLFARLVCIKAPYFRTVKPQFKKLEPGYCEIHIRKRRAVLNHIGSVHAIAMCNVAELAAGTMTEVTVPATHRWIPKEMTVRYLKKATTNLRAIAKPVGVLNTETAGEYHVSVSVIDETNTEVFSADITMWISPKVTK
jgi:uncharacterized protein (TIGR00369 family)